YVGQILKVPANVDFTAANTSSSSASNPVKTNSPTSTVATTNYKVKSGDTLIGIANSVGISPEELAAVNPNFDAKARLQRGQTIKVPVTKDLVDRQLNDKAVSYKVKSGDTLTGVAQRYNIGLSDLAAANNLKTNSNLILGRTITIPANGTVSVASTSNNTSNNSKSSTASTETASSTSAGKKLGNTES